MVIRWVTLLYVEVVISHGHQMGDVIVCRGGNFSIHVGAASDSSGGVVDFFAGDFTQSVDGFVLPIYCVVFILGLMGC
jgi:hypothetical protein